MHEAKRRAILAVAVFLVCAGPCSQESVADVTGPSVVAVGSDHVVIAWPRFRGASEVRVSIAPEPRSDARVRVATLPGRADRVRIDALAPGAHVFARVEPVGSDQEGVELHARTLGGPDANLDGPVREVAMMAPNVLALVMASGDGPGWQRGPWRVERRDGESVAVRKVHRHSVPVGQPGYEIGFGAADDLTEVRVDHRLFLILAEPVGSPEVLRVEGPRGLAMTVPVSDRYLETPVIQLNQVGYDPGASRRHAYVSGWLGDGGGLSLDGFPDRAQVLHERDDPRALPAVVGTVSIRRRSVLDRDVGGPVHEIDLSALPTSDDIVYRVRLPGVGVSYPTRVSEAAVREAYRTILRGLFHQRWGGELGRRYTTHPRPSDHPFVYTGSQADAFSFFPEDTPRQGRRRLRGGYHDAADFDQRPMHTVVPQVLMRAYELRPEAFADGGLDIPESGNGIPDLLDEALWGVAGWAQLQERDGGVRAGVESTRHPPGIYMAHQDRLDYFTFAPDAQVTARAAGLFAQASRLVRPHDAARARELRQRALRAWRWADARGARDCYALYALGELYRLTGDEAFASAFEERWRRIGPYGAFSNFALYHNLTRDYRSGGQVMPDYILGYLTAEGADPEIRALALRWITQHADRVARSLLDSPHAHRSPRASLAPDWGLGSVMGRYLDPLFARLALGGLDDARERRYRDAVSLAADYVLGANPLGRPFLTGLGARPPREPLHLDSLVHIREGRGPVPGIPVYGPVSGLPDAWYYRPAREAFHPRFDQHPRMRRYADVRSFVNTSECTVWECQAPHAEHFAVLLGM